jgi:hypothetical protein
VDSQLDLFSSKNIIVPAKNKIISNSVVIQKPNNIINSNSIIIEQKKFEIIDVISFNPKKIDSLNKKKEESEKAKAEKKFKKSESDKKHKNSSSYKTRRIKKWNNFLFHGIKASIRKRNSGAKRTYNRGLIKYNNLISNGISCIPPKMYQLYGHPDFKDDFFLKLWDIQNGLDAYTNVPMIISDVLNPFNPSCDRIDSNINYIKGNVVLCCFSTNQSKHKFDIYSKQGNNWLEYVTNHDSVKKQEIFDRIKRIQTLSLE